MNDPIFVNRSSSEVILKLHNPEEYLYFPSGNLNDNDHCSTDPFLFLLKCLLEEEMDRQFPSSCFSIESLDLTFDDDLHGYLTLCVDYHVSDTNLDAKLLQKLMDEILADLTFNCWDDHHGCLNSDGLSLFLKYALKRDREFTISETVKEIKELHSSIQDLQKQLELLYSFLAEINPLEWTGSIFPENYLSQ